MGPAGLAGRKSGLIRPPPPPPPLLPYTHKAVHTQGGAHKRRSVATVGVLLFKGGVGAGPRVERSEPKQRVCIRVGNSVGGGGGGNRPDFQLAEGPVRLSAVFSAKKIGG